jgi:hypothetical protein
MRLQTIDIDPANVSLTGFASNVTGATFVLTANDSGDGLAHQVSIRNDTVNDHSAKTVTLVGTDADGKALTEIVTGPGVSATVESVGYFLTLTSATPSATIGADTFDIGWVDEVASKMFPLNWRNNSIPTISVDVTGTIAYTLQQCFQNVLAGETPVWQDVGTLGYATAIRIRVDSYTDTAELQAYIVHPDAY